MAITKVDAHTQVVKGLIAGKPFTTIARELDETPERVHQMWQDYLEQNYTPVTDVEMRYLSLARFERLLEVLWNQVEAGDFATEGKQTSNVIKVIEQINTLMNLNKNPLTEAQVELTKAQTALAHGILVELRGALLTKVTQSLGSLGLTDSAQELLRTEVESQWGSWYYEASREALAITKKGDE